MTLSRRGILSSALGIAAMSAAVVVPVVVEAAVLPDKYDVLADKLRVMNSALIKDQFERITLGPRWHSEEFEMAKHKVWDHVQFEFGEKRQYNLPEGTTLERYVQLISVRDNYVNVTGNDLRGLSDEEIRYLFS